MNSDHVNGLTNAYGLLRDAGNYDPTTLRLSAIKIREEAAIVADRLEALAAAKDIGEVGTLVRIV